MASGLHPDAQMPEHHRPNFSEIVRNTLMVGGGSAVNMAIGLLRNKCAATLLGPSGVALTAVFTQIFEVGGAATGLGLGASGVRQIAAAQASGDPLKVARVAKTLRRTVWCTGGFALVLVVACSGLISQFTFGSAEYRGGVMLMAVTIFIRALMTSQTCILQGSRRVADTVKIGIIGALAALVTYVPFAYYMGPDGIAPGIVCATVMNLGVSWWYARKVPIADIEHSWAHTRHEVGGLLAFGLPMMLTSLVGTFGPYLERVVLLRTIGLEQLGQYQAAYALTGVTLGFVLSAMTADYYPKLMAHLGEPARLDKEVNAQIEISLLFALPGAVWMAVGAPLLISLLYTHEFAPAVAILAITVFGIIGRVLSWPLRLVLMAQGRSALLFIIEMGFTVIGIALLWILSSRHGAIGAGYAFVGIHILYAVSLVLAAPRLLGVRVSARNLRMALVGLAIITALAVNDACNPWLFARWALNITVGMAVSWACLAHLSHHTGWPLPGIRRRAAPPAPEQGGFGP